MFGIRHPALQGFCLLVLVALDPSGVAAADLPWRAAQQGDLDGTWRQVGVVVLDPKSDRNDPWFQAKQFFRFPPDGTYRHVLVNPDSEPERTTPTKMQRWMLEEGPSTQRLTWRVPGIGFVKHPERPPQRIDFGLYLRDAPTGPHNAPLKPRKGDLILVYYSYKDVNIPLYFRLLRKHP